MRVVVIGASSGLGRCIGIGLARRGANVALLARRDDKLKSAVAEIEASANEGAGTGVAIACDATDAASVDAAIGRAARELGGIDAVVYCPGLSILAPISEIDSATWHRAFDINVVGASLVAAAALPHLNESRGTMAFLTSLSASQTSPWPGLSSYVVSKAALDKLVEAWRAEHPDIGFTRVIVGECVGGEGDGVTGITDGWDRQLTEQYFATWFERGLLTEKLMDIDDLVGALDGVLRTGASASIPTVAITPRRPL